MIISDFYKKLVDVLELPTAYREFSEEESETLETPYCVYFVDDVETLEADNIVYWTRDIIMLEIYTDNKDLELENKVETFLDDNEWVYEKGEDHIPQEQLFVVFYKFSI